MDLAIPAFPALTQLAIPAFVGLILVELFVLRRLRRGAGFETRDTMTSLFMGVGNVVSGLLFGFVAYGVLVWFYEYRLFTIGFEWYWILTCFLIDDLRYYVYHRIAHRCRWVWAEHVIHHSSQHYNLSTALRQSWTGIFTGMFVLRIPLVLAGFHPALIVFVGGINLLYQFWIHTETIGKMPRWFEFIMNTPSHHRVHHATNPRYLDANYAGTLIIWDRMFGTFVEELESDLPRYGLVRNIGTFNPFRVAFHEWVDMFRDAIRPGLNPGQRFGYLFRPPGWRHDVAVSGSEAIKQEFVERNPAEASKPGLPALEENLSSGR
ncbi:MAG: sterol desaturase family protein [Rhizobiaceae bacterium]|nr:sterol desaturase family protein [Rhizobiaceae bacterium]